MNAARPVATPVVPLDAAHAKLRKMAHQLEGMFVRQLFAAMREATPQESVSGNAGGPMFTSMMDDALAGQAADRLERGIGEALYRQLSRRLDAGAAPAEVRPGIEATPSPAPVEGLRRPESATVAAPVAVATGAVTAAPARESR